MKLNALPTSNPFIMCTVCNKIHRQTESDCNDDTIIRTESDSESDSESDASASVNANANASASASVNANASASASVNANASASVNAPSYSDNDSNSGRESDDDNAHLDFMGQWYIPIASFCCDGCGRRNIGESTRNAVIVVCQMWQHLCNDMDYCEQCIIETPYQYIIMDRDTLSISGSSQSLEIDRPLMTPDMYQASYPDDIVVARAGVDASEND